MKFPLTFPIVGYGAEWERLELGAQVQHHPKVIQIIMEEIYYG